jgi:hypothetical protein
MSIFDDTLHVQMKRIGIIYNPRAVDAVNYGKEVEKILAAKNITAWLCSAWEPDKASRKFRDRT